MNEQTCVGTGQVEQGDKTESITKGAGASQITTGKASPATMGARKRRENCTFPDPVDGARWIPLTKGMFALVDAGDFEQVNKKIWTAAKGNTTYYAIFREQPSKRTISLHRWILGIDDDCILVDHFDFNGLNCRRLNLRACSKTENNRHSRKWRTPTFSKFKGVSFDSRYRSKWSAQLTINRKKIYLGRFYTEEDAALAYNALAENLFGQFAVLNVIP